MRGWLAAAVAALLVAGCSPDAPAPGPAPVVELPGATGVYGVLHLPAGGKGTRRPAVLVVGGAEGGLSVDPLAAALARAGVPALAVAYFGVPGVPELPSTLTSIPLEYFATALRLLAARPGVDPARITVWGVSRGSEAAQLLAADYPELVHAVVADSPSSVVHAASSDPDTAAWTLGGRPVAFVGAAGFDDPDAEPGALPPARVPILTICGGADRLWPAGAFAATIAARAPQTVALVYPAAGHSFVGLQLQGTSAPGVAERMRGAGGTAEANADAAADAFTRTVAFVETASTPGSH